MANDRWQKLPDAFSEFDRLQADMQRLFGLNSIFDNSGLFDRVRSTPIDVIEHEDDLVVYMNVPGVSLKDIDLSVASNVLTVKGERKQHDDAQKVHRDESWTGSFQRTISLPNSVDTDKIKADLKDGVLKIKIGKRAETKPKQIQVRAA
jgi:HSP20 family protein